ncbi:hypothetical protein ACFOGJ_08885 [Marinibaculum pumilum]|uniref:Glycosyltransferase n=1 Tax=Marinibaculum pumilum TaxID=1766165 RepID=A0ABV7KZD4_9PROT
MSAPPTVVVFCWGGEREYTLAHAKTVQDMIRRHCAEPVRFVAISDEPPIDGLEVMPMPEGAKALAHLKTPEGDRFPSSYRRLWLFSDEARCLGERILLTDIDVVATGDWSPFWQSGADFVGWRPVEQWGRGPNRLAGGMWLLRTGTRPEVYDRFVRDPAACIAEARAADYRGSDQAWISYCLARSAEVWPAGAGIGSIRHLAKGHPQGRTFSPGRLRVVHFNGRDKPWHASVQAKHRWVAQHWGPPSSPGREMPRGMGTAAAGRHSLHRRRARR